MATTRTYEDFAGTLGRRVARVKEACGGAVARHRPGGKARRGSDIDPGFSARAKRDTTDIDPGFVKPLSPDNIWSDGEDHDPGFVMPPRGEGEHPDKFPTFYPSDIKSLANDLGVEGPLAGTLYDLTPIEALSNSEAFKRALDKYREKLGIWDENAVARESVARQKSIRMKGLHTLRDWKETDIKTLGKGGNIMNYTVYFKDGGLLPRSQRRVYQTGGKASAQDTMQQLYQLTQVAVSGSGQEQRQAMQALGQFVGEAMNGNEQYAQIIQAVFDGAKKGSREMTQMAQVFQSIMQQMQKREFGGRLDYITMLRNGGRPRYQTGGGFEGIGGLDYSPVQGDGSGIARLLDMYDDFDYGKPYDPKHGFGQLMDHWRNIADRDGMDYRDKTSFENWLNAYERKVSNPRLKNRTHVKDIYEIGKYDPTFDAVVGPHPIVRYGQ